MNQLFSEAVAEALVLARPDIDEGQHHDGTAHLGARPLGSSGVRLSAAVDVRKRKMGT